jgi:FlaA1/EpsC-like NDP-sugar epimerase
MTTDQAVEPVSVYGVSKYLCEKLVLDTAREESLRGGDQAFMVVRFGNVLGSRGSIVPLFQKQIENGGPVTVTHPEMRRWFMTIPEACSLVLKAGGVGENGNLYLLDMGDPVKIQDLAEQMIRFYGFEPERDIRIEYIGLRPGERLDEKLWGEDEIPRPTGFDRILRVEREDERETGIREIMEELRPLCFLDPAFPSRYRDSALLRNILRERIPAYAQGVEKVPEKTPRILEYAYA